MLVTARQQAHGGETPSSHDIIPTLFGDPLIQIIFATARSIYPACRMNERELP
jgi:hypothetical protein